MLIIVLVLNILMGAMPYALWMQSVFGMQNFYFKQTFEDAVQPTPTPYNNDWLYDETSLGGTRTTWQRNGSSGFNITVVNGDGNNSSKYITTMAAKEYDTIFGSNISSGQLVFDVRVKTPPASDASYHNIIFDNGAAVGSAGTTKLMQLWIYKDKLRWYNTTSTTSNYSDITVLPDTWYYVRAVVADLNGNRNVTLYTGVDKGNFVTTTGLTLIDATAVFRKIRFISSTNTALSLDDMMLYTGNNAPTAAPVLTGTPMVGRMIVGGYTFQDEDGNPELGSRYVLWMAGDSGFKVNKEIVQSDNCVASSSVVNYTFQASDVDKYFRLEIFPDDGLYPQAQSVLSNIIGPVYDIPATKPVATDVLISGAKSDGSVLTGKYTFFDENGDIEEGSILRWLRFDSLQGVSNDVYEEIHNASVTYTTKAEDIGKYIVFEVTPRTNIEPGIGETERSVPFGPIFRCMPPVANEVAIEGTLSVGSSITGKYTFFDANGDVENGTSYQWYRQDEIDTEPLSILGANSLTYLLSEQDNGKYLRFSVLPRTNPHIGSPVETDIGTTSYSEPFLAGAPPEGHSVNILGKAQIHEVLVSDYTFYDADGDMEKNSIIRWYRGESEQGPWNLIPDIHEKCYLLDTADINKYIKFGIVPMSDTRPMQGPEVCSSAIGPVAAPPDVNSVRITGSARSGGTLRGEYDFNDFNGDVEMGSTYQWYRSDSVSFNVYQPINGAVFKAYTITDADAGKYLRFEVTPRTVPEPSTGNTVCSNTIHVNDNDGSVRISSGGKVSSGGGNIIPINSSITDTVTYGDIKTHWAKETIERLAAMGIVSGVGDNSFEPDRGISRAEFVVLVVRALHLDSTSYDNSFTDVENGSWYADALQTAVQAGIITGNDGIFRPEETVTREEMTKIIVEAYRMKDGVILTSESLELFHDRSEISPWAVEYVKAANGLGLIKGISDSEFSPKRNATRAQVAVIIERLMQK